MMKKVALLLPNGYEEMEALAVVDMLRRADVQVDMVSITGKLLTIGDHNVRIEADLLLEDIRNKEYDMIVTPGGLPGTKMLQADTRVHELIRKQLADKSRYVASICASPMVLESAGVAKDYRGTCYPGCEANISYKEFSEDIVCQDGNLITSRGPATALSFAFKLVEVLAGPEKRKELEEGTLYSLIHKHRK